MHANTQAPVGRKQFKPAFPVCAELQQKYRIPEVHGSLGGRSKCVLRRCLSGAWTNIHRH